MKNRSTIRATAITALAIAISAPAMAASGVSQRDASDRTAQVEHQVAMANKSGDAATIADARAKLQAARAAEWAIANPAPDPNKQVRPRAR